MSEPAPGVGRVCVVTGGGDAPGINAVLHGLVTRAASLGIEVVGSEDGFDGLVTGRVVPLEVRAVQGIASTGGSIIGCSNRADPFAYVDRGAPRDAAPRDESARVTARLAALQAGALVAIGGDGTMAMTERFARLGVRCVGVPKTIDNDLGATDVTFGFQSAVECATWAVDRLHSTAAAHDRVIILEVMGRHAGWIAIESGMAGGAHVVVIPEIPYDARRVAAKLQARARAGLTYSIIVVAEGAHPAGGDAPVVDHVAGAMPRLGGAGERLRRELEAMVPEHEVRVTVLGHLQRGGTPSAFDRNLGMRYGVAAADLVARGAFGRMVALRDGAVVDVALADAVSKPRRVPPDGELCRTARALGIELGAP